MFGLVSANLVRVSCHPGLIPRLGVWGGSCFLCCIRSFLLLPPSSFLPPPFQRNATQRKTQHTQKQHTHTSTVCFQVGFPAGSSHPICLTLPKRNRKLTHHTHHTHTDTYRLPVLAWQVWDLVFSRGSDVRLGVGWTPLHVTGGPRAG